MADENSPSGDPAANGESIGRPVSQPGPHVPAEADRGETATFDKQALLQSSYTPKIDGYTVAREISRGGQAVVYQATQHATHRRVAVKVMLEGPYAGPAQRARFDREVQILAALEHPHIVSVVDRGVTAEGAFYFVMEYVEGCSLDEHLTGRRPAAEGPEEVKTALRLFMEVCDAVNAAHLRGVVHRDLKPSNIHIDSRGEPRILDFGLARTALPGYADADSQSPVTITGQFLGSLPWSSPEQAEGRHSLIDTRTDVYSLGVILYQILTGEFPYAVAGSMREVLENITHTEPSPPSEVIAARDEKDAGVRTKRSRTHLLPISPALDAVVLKALAKKREDRYQSAGELSRDIANVLAGRPTIAAGIPRTRRWPKLALLAGGGAVLAAAVALTVYLVWPGEEPPSPSPQTPPGGGSAKDSAAAGAVPGWPFDAAEAKRRQQAAAKAHGVPVEKALDLGGGVPMKLVLIPPGSFQMGSGISADELVRRFGRTKEHYTSAHPQHTVVISKPFYMGVTEVTRGQFAAFVADSAYRTEAEKEDSACAWNGKKWEQTKGASWRNPGFEQTDDHPVVCVSWNDAVAFCKWLSGKTGRRASLPTEAQWEYACRAGTGTAFPWGDDPDDGDGWCNAADRTWKAKFSDWVVFNWSDGYVCTSPAGRFRANSYGLQDMIGNVLEWCSDCRGRYTSGRKTDPQGVFDGKYRVARGGGWHAPPSECRSADRGGNSPPFRCDVIGFRVSVSLGSADPPAKPTTKRSSAWLFDAAEAKRRQQAAAKAAGVPVETALDLRESVTMKLVLIPPGRFLMGSGISADEVLRRLGGKKGYFAEEHPQHAVTISKAFYLGVTEVTRGQFAAFVADSGYRTDAEKQGWATALGADWTYGKTEGASWRSPGFEQTDDHPVVCVSWNDAAAFCKWLGRKTRRRVSLPTEAQWEYACRAGTSTLFPWGNDPDDGKGWCNAGDRTSGVKHAAWPEWPDFHWTDGYVYTAPVGRFRTNTYGLQDMIGNAWEWCADWGEPYHGSAGQDDPQGPRNGTHRVLRGGSWFIGGAQCRSAYRLRGTPASRYVFFGFRVSAAAWPAVDSAPSSTTLPR